jgi:trans-2,3-dihydro-3-hydroxyanthranilate isomerase
MAFVLATERRAEVIRLKTGAGVIPVALTWDRDRVVFGEMDQSIPAPEQFARAGELLSALGVRRSELPVEAYRNGPLHVYVTLDSEEAVSAVAPDMAALAALGPLGAACIAGDGARLKTRNFAPALGVAEDPATGSAAGPLALHLVRHGLVEPGQQIEIRQGAEISRPSRLYARVEGSPQRVERVVVGGSAVIVARGEYRLH